MSDIEGKLSSGNEQDNSTASYKRKVVVISADISERAAIYQALSAAQVVDLVNSDTEDESEFDIQLDDIFTKLHAADDRIAKDRQETVHLGQETKAMLTELRKQLG